MQSLGGGAGTGGTITGTDKYIKEQSPETKIVSGNPVKSILAHPASLNESSTLGFKMEGIGCDFRKGYD